MFLYQQNHRYFAQIAEGLEELGAEELRRLGGREIRAVYRGFYFEADPSALYRINYQSRLATRVLAPLAAFTCHETDYLYRQVKLIPWKEIMQVDQTLAVFTHLTHSKIRHSQYAGLCVKDAIADYFRQDCGRRPDVRRMDPDVWINLFLDTNRAVISLDASGGSLHRRGYRRAGVEAPMQETVAAAVIRWTEWDGDRPLVDPMCGSGTLLAEALMHYCRIPAGFLRRRFGLEQLPDFDRTIWAQVKAAADREIRPLPEAMISGSDIASQAVATAAENLRNLPHGSDIRLQRVEFCRRNDLSGAAIVCNPPYGIRLKNTENIAAFYRAFGDYLKQHCRGAIAFVYFGNREMLKHIGLKPSWKHPLRNGGLDGRLAKFEMY